MARSELTDQLRSALHEVNAYSDGRNFLYWWRRASMSRLAEMGLVETWRPKSLENSRSKTLPYRITEAGRHALSCNIHEGSDGG